MTRKMWVINLQTKKYSKQEFDRPNLSMDEIVSQLPSGVYTTMRTVCKTKIFQFQYHLNRIVESYQLSSGKFPYEINNLRHCLHTFIQEFSSNEVRIRIQIPLSEPHLAYVILEELTIPTPEDYKNGVSVITNKLIRDNPKAKLTSFIVKSEDIKKKLREQKYEESIIINSQNQLLEGLSSNFFAVKNFKIFTAEKDVLNGATREIIIEEARKANIPVILEAITIDEMHNIDESFITSTSRGLLPIVKIESKQIGDGKPGSISMLLMDKLNMRMIMEAENII